MENTARKHASIIINGQDSAVLEDTYLLAALLTLDPSIKYNPLRDSSGRVAFEVYGKISDLMRRLYEGESAPLNGYIKNLKMLRAKIFALKARPEQTAAATALCAFRVDEYGNTRVA